MKTRRVFATMAVLLMMTATFSVPLSVLATHKSMDTWQLNNGMDIFVRPKLAILSSFLGNESSNHNGTTLVNLTGTAIEVKKNYTFSVKISDRDQSGPNLTYVRNVTLVSFVSFEKDPGFFKPNGTNKYNHRNYEFQFNATRISGGGNTPSIWNLTMNYPSMGPNAEVKFMKDNSSWVNETDLFKKTGAPGSDGANDTIEFRWAFSLGPQCRNTNISGNHSIDDWLFYAAATDIYGVSNTSKGHPNWVQKYDVDQYTEVFGGGAVGGRGVPGGGKFRLDLGAQLYHQVNFRINNNASFYVNVTNFTAGWPSSTLKVVYGYQADLDSSNWTTVGPHFSAYIGNGSHPYNGTRSYESPGPGEGGSGMMYWQCTGIPLGIASGKYNATVFYRVRLTGT